MPLMNSVLVFSWLPSTQGMREICPGLLCVAAPLQCAFCEEGAKDDSSAVSGEEVRKHNHERKEKHVSNIKYARTVISTSRTLKMRERFSRAKMARHKMIWY
jgi:hypothetical protein